MPHQEKQPTTAERLELHNLATLVKSASAKRAAGKPLTKREIAAVEELEQRQAAPKPVEASGIDPQDVCRLLVAFSAGSIDEQLIRSVLGGVLLRSTAQVAAFFGVEHSTVKNNWRQNGMPGKAKRGTNRHNEYPLDEIFIWWINREDRIAKRRGKNPYSDRINAIEAERAEVELQLARAKLAAVRSDLVSMELVRSDVAAAFTDCRDSLLEIPRHIKPMLPAKVAEDISTEVDRVIRFDLVALSEKLEAACDGQNHGENLGSERIVGGDA